MMFKEAALKSFNPGTIVVAAVLVGLIASTASSAVQVFASVVVFVLLFFVVQVGYNYYRLYRSQIRDK